ncbi:hypothetical protein BCV70DRAFT_237727 [Testicularia cyperi]|uniref:Protein CASP n=1 Tax=Testicularia cyperi TaxID=1882483 RepID=A0A317XNF4_9BASI|nr:hypothetical protein BCV70DRAFT_237727 [Testicularia cyperi]
MLSVATAAQPYDANGVTSQSAPAQPTDFSGALAVWKDINLAELQQQLISVAPALIEAQKLAVINRKNLADQTRDFKKQPDENKLESVKPLLKAYQAEIDALTKRSKAAENAFLNVHSAISTAPDPYPFLEVVIDQAASLTDLDVVKQENAGLKQQLAQLKDDASQKDTDESEKKSLYNRIRQLEEGFEARVQERSAAIEKELSAKWDERLRNMDEREKDLTKSLNVAQQQLRDLKSRDESTTAKLLEKGHDEDEREVKGKLAEMELLTRDLERAQTRVETVERRNEQLRAEIESVKSGRQESEKTERLEKESEEKDRKIVQLQSLVEKERQQSSQLSADNDKLRDEHLKLQKDREAEISTLRTKLHQRGDYEEVRRELDILKMVHFSGEDEDDELEEAGLTEGAKGSQTEAKSLETLLLEKNRKLENQLTALRVSHGELTSVSSNSASELAQLRKEVARLKSLNEKLENDLVSVGTESRSATKGISAMSAEDALKEMDLLEAEASGRSKSKSSKSNGNGTGAAELTAKATTATSGTPRSSTTATPTSGTENSLLPIITSQRDRFRARNAELEEELRKQFETISELRAEVKTLQSDNLGLYEKVRYLQSYGPSGTAGRGGDAVINFGSGPNAVGVAGRVDATGAYPPPRVVGGPGEDKYRVKYEESMNPFEAFRGREQSRAMAQLNPLERALHVITRLVVSHRRMRLLFMLYAIGLHLLVFGMLFEASTSSGATYSTEKAAPPPPI